MDKGSWSGRSATELRFLGEFAGGRVEEHVAPQATRKFARVQLAMFGRVNVREALQRKANAEAATGEDHVAHQRGEQRNVVLTEGPEFFENYWGGGGIWINFFKYKKIINKIRNPLNFGPNLNITQNQKLIKIFGKH